MFEVCAKNYVLIPEKRIQNCKINMASSFEYLKFYQKTESTEVTVYYRFKVFKRL